LFFSIAKSILVNMIAIMVISHFFGCLWYWIGTREVPGEDSWLAYYHLDQRDWVFRYLTALHWSLTQFTPGSMDVHPQNSRERGYAIFMLISGMMIFSSIVSNITTATNNLRHITARFDNELSNLRRFCRQHSISKLLVVRTTKYCNHIVKPKMSQLTQNEVHLLSMLPKQLYMEVVLELYDQYIEVHPFFLTLKLQSRIVMQKLCNFALHKIVLTKGDELFGPGETAEMMYFVVEGDLTYVHEHDELAKEIRVKKRDWFCEAVLWTPWVFLGRMIASNETELVALNSQEFRKIMNQHQGDLWLPKIYGNEFVRGMNEVAESEDHALTQTLNEQLYIESAVLMVTDAAETRASGERWSLDPIGDIPS